MAEQKAAPGLPLSARVVFGVLLVLEVLIAIFALEAMHLATWPAFVAMIMFFIVHENVKEIKNIIIGGAFGITNFFLCMLFVSSTAYSFASFGNMTKLIPVMIYVAIFVFLIVLLTQKLPWLFNSYAFMYFSVAFADLASFMANHNIWIYWLAVEVVAGTLLILGVVGIQKFVASMVKKQMQKAAGSLKLY